MQRFLALLMLLACASAPLSAQQMVTGTVATSSGAPIENAAVTAGGGVLATASDADGHFTLSLPDSLGQLRIVHPDFVARKVKVKGAGPLDVILQLPADRRRQVVTGLGKLRTENSLGYAISPVSGATLSTARENHVVNALTGRIAGAQIENNVGGLGGSSAILLRGVRSMTGINRPLYVVDGVPVADYNPNGASATIAAGGRDYGSTVQDINPADIATISVLRPGAASAIYGTRGSNGVILITTRSGTEREGVGVTISSGVSFQQVASLPEYQNQYGGGYGRDFGVFTFDPDEHPAAWSSFDGQLLPDYTAEASWGPELTGQMVRHWDSWFPGEHFGELRPWSPNPDNVSNFYETGMSLDNHFALAGGHGQTRYRVAYTNTNSTGVYPESRLNRNTLHLNASQRIGNKLEASLTGSFVNTRAAGRPALGYGGFGDAVNVQGTFNEWFQRQLDMDRLLEYQSPDGSPRSWNHRGPEDLNTAYWESPYWVVYQDRSQDGRDRLYGNLSLTYTPRPGLSVTGSARTDYFNFRVNDRMASGSTANAPYAEEMQVYSRENNYQVLADYSPQLTGDFSVNLQVGGNLRREDFTSRWAKTSGGVGVPGIYTVENSLERPLRTDFSRERQVQTVFGRAGVGYKSLFFLDVAGRSDRTSALEAGYSSSVSPSASTAFVFSELLRSRILSYGKLRAGIAMTANDPAPYQTRRIYNATVYDRYVPTYTVSDRQANPELMAEHISTWEAGLDLAFLNDRLGLGLTYYVSQSTNLIIDRPLGGTTGFYAQTSNGGAMTNTGVELELNAKPVSGDKLSWDTYLNVGMNRNEVIELAEGQDELILRSYRVQFTARPGAPFGTLMGQGYLRNENGQKIIDDTGMPVLAGGVEFGSAYPDITGSFTNDLSYGPLHLHTLIDFRMGGLVYSESNRWGTYSGILASTVGTNENGVDVRQSVSDGGGIPVEGVTLDGAPNTTYVDAQRYFENLRHFHEEFVYDASFVKLREISLGYDLPESLPGDGGTVSLFVRNAATLYQNAPNIDPETALTNETIRGFENGQNPSVRSVGLRLQLQF